MTIRWLLAGVAAAALSLPLQEIHPVVETEPGSLDVDDPAIWVNPAARSRSLVIGTVKRPKPDGALVVYSLNGQIVETVGDLDRPNNVDVLGDLCAVTERMQRRLLLYRVHAAKPHLRFLGAVPLFDGEPGEKGAPMGIALYRRSKDKALFAIVSRKTGPADGYLWQYRLRVEGVSVQGHNVRAFGKFSGTGEIEAVAVDAARGLVYYSDEDCCVRVYRADPDTRDAAAEVDRFAEEGFQGNREGIAIAGDYVIVTDQLDPRSEYHVYRRADRAPLAIWRGVSQSTDGIEAVSAALGPAFPRGMLAAMNNSTHNFHFYALP